MKTKLLILPLFAISALGFSQQNFWSKTSAVSASKKVIERQSTPKTYALYQLNLDQMKNALSKAPDRFSKNESLVLKFPNANGQFKDYIIQEASVMEPELQAKFPEIRSYVGWQKDNAGNSIRFSVTPKTGISVMYFDGADVSYLDMHTDDLSSFMLYKRKDLQKSNYIFECDIEKSAEEQLDNPTQKAPLISDGQFRTYRLALSATGEYTAFHGGTVNNAMAAMATTMTRVNGVYEKTASLTMVMVANNNLIVYTNSSTDPFSNGNPNSMITQNQSNTTSVIGSANYDVGHVFGTDSGGLAGLGVICISNSKAKGVTGSGAPINDPFDIDYVAHELGHQFGANHTFRAASGSCNGNANSATAYEPGGGTTIMAYAGICGPNNNIQSNSDAYFHAASIVEINAVIMRSGDCSVKTNNNNGTPTANAGLDYTIPNQTAFVLTGVGTDPNQDTLTYLWEQYNSQTSTQPPVATATGGPIYRSFSPSTSPNRYFPMLSSVVANQLTPKWEVTPSVARTLNFSLVVSDNKATGNQSANDAMVVTVANVGPFKVTSHTSNMQLDGLSATEVKWDVAGTNAAPINTQFVTILLSKDNGLTFDTVLASSVPNNGQATVVLPNETVSSARIMVKAVNNIYYALNSSFFSIKETPLANNEVNKVRSSIYPNPAKDVIYIKLDAKVKAEQYSLYDLSGKLVKQGVMDHSNAIKTNNLPSGNYILNINLSDGTKLQEKLIIKK